MSVYTASLLWRSIEELFERRNDDLTAVVGAKDLDFALVEYFQKMIPGESEEDISAAFELLNSLAVSILKTVDDDFEHIKYSVKISNPAIRKYFGPKEAKAVIQSFENDRQLKMTRMQKIVVIYIVFITGERELKDFNALSKLIDIETPEADQYISLYKAKSA